MSGIPYNRNNFNTIIKDTHFFPTLRCSDTAKKQPVQAGCFALQDGAGIILRRRAAPHQTAGWHWEG